MKKIIEVFLEGKLYSKKPGYFDLNQTQTDKLIKEYYIIEQIRLRVLSERMEEYSVALNHLLNEIHAICHFLDKHSSTEIKNYQARNVQTFLIEKGVPHNISVKIRNLFDRRNKNPVSHPGSDGSSSWGVTKDEYWEYHHYVGECLKLIL